MNTEVELITVPVTFLIGIEDKMKHLRESLIGKRAVLTKVRTMMINTMLIMKTNLLFQVIQKQQLLIKEQGKVIKTLGGEYEAFNDLEFADRMKLLKKDKLEDCEESDEGRNTSSLHDSALDESGEDIKETEDDIDQQINNNELFDISNEDDNSDSYVTMSDASFTDSAEEEEDHMEEEEDPTEEEVDHISEEEDEMHKSGCFGVNPFFEKAGLKQKEESEVNKSKSEEAVLMLEKSPTKLVHVKDTETSEKIQPKLVKLDLFRETPAKPRIPQYTMETREIFPLKTIGDPEKLETPSKQGRDMPNVLQKFKKPRGEHQGRLLKSKSEGNLSELVESEPKPSFFQSIYRGLMTRHKKQEQGMKAKSFYQSSPCLAYDENEIEMTEQRKTPFFQKPPYQEDQMKSLPFLHESRGESLNSNFFHQPLFSCFNTVSKPMMPNHKNVQRPRDVKNKSHRRFQNASRFDSMI